MLGLAGTACLLLLAPLAGASNGALYSDGTADAPSAAPDLTAVQVSNDDAGEVVFRITIPNRARLADTDLVSLLVDADGKTGTGCARGIFGAEYALDVLAGRYVFGRCLRGRWEFGRRPISFGGSFATSTLTLKANRRDLGGTGRFAFRVGAAAVTQADPAYDFAPDVGTAGWSYEVIAPPQAIMKPPQRHRRACRQRPRRCKITRRQPGSGPRASPA
jgi:hypothetical protein